MRRGAMLATSYGVGSLEASGRMDAIPQLMGMPRTLTVGGAALLASLFVRGKGGHLIEGVADGALSIAAYQFARPGAVSGAPEDELAELEADLRRAEAMHVSGLEDELTDEVEAEVLG